MPVPRTPYGTRGETRPGTLLLDRNEGKGHDDARRDLSVSPGRLSRYPNAGPLELQLATRLGLDPDRVLVTAGADDAIDRVCRASLGERHWVLTHRPTFEMLHRYASLAGGMSRAIPWTRGTFPTADFLAEFSDEVGLVALVSPNNPTGSTLTVDTLCEIAEAVGPTPLLLDLAYIEYADDDFTASALGFPNVVIARTLSKAWGLAGCRVGYALGSPLTINILRAAGAPYPVSGPSLEIAAATIEHAADETDRHVSEVTTRRHALSQILSDAGSSVFPSQANFVLAEFGPRAEWVRDSLAALDVLVRDFSAVPELDGALRVSVPTDTADLETVRRALETLRAPGAILFDLDGVLVDVRDSYRQCILRTAQTFGVTLTDADVHEIKAEGDANNDWEVTRRLLARRGIDIPLAEVTAEFQTHYLGTGGDGLVSTERPFIPADTLKAIAARYPIAVVTGRPRVEARQALDRFGFSPFITHLVAMEDAPAKPDPAPVRLALDALEVESAWMFGDTPDDIVAARAAGVLPLGVDFTDDASPARGALVKSGPATIVTHPDQLTQVLPS